MDIRRIDENLEFRKVQTSGKASYIFCLPKNWVESNGIKKGDVISVKYVGDDLVISKVHKGKKAREKTVPKIVVDNFPSGMLPAIVQGAYIDGFDNIEMLTEKGEMDPSIKRLVMDTLQDLIGFEVISDSKNSIIIQNISEPSEFNLKKVVDQLFRLAYEMIVILLESLTSRNPNVVENIETKKRMVNRLNLLSQRLVNQGISNKAIALKIELESNIHAIHWGNVIRLLNCNTATMFKMAKLVETINSFKIPDDLLDMYKKLPADREIPRFQESVPSHKRNLDFDLLVYQEIQQFLEIIEEVRKKAAEKALEPKLRLHLEKFNNMLQNLYENSLEYIKEMICLEHLNPLKK
jgi:phosphate uptake regulator